MSQAELQTDAPGQPSSQRLEQGTYEIIRNRLHQHGQDLRQRLERLNEARKEVFGTIDTALIATERITTEHNCVPRDMVAIGNRLLFGYNVHLGLKSEMQLADVFAAYEFREGVFHPLSLEFLKDPQFEKDFRDVYRYYKNATFAKFFVNGPYLYLKFQVGKGAADFKSFKWLVRGADLQYVDNRSDHELRYPPQHEFEWKRTSRDMHRSGAHPHIAIEDRLFVETIGGDLTIKVENNTDSGEGIYEEPVDHRDQTLDDAEIFYAIVGNLILLKIRPYQEQKFRFIVYNEKIKQARRLDAIEHACVLLPDDQGLIFSNGYYLQTGESKTFENNLQNMLFERRIAAVNGEDFLYVFYNQVEGVYILLPYNLIEQRVETPIVSNGFCLFQAGEMLCFKSQPEPQKHHAVQVWQTPYVGENYVPHTNSDSYLFKVGNRDLVRGMAECQEILKLIDKDESYEGLYIDLAREAGDVIDSYFWIDKPETFHLKEPLSEIRSAATSAIDEFEKVVRVRQNTTKRSEEVQQQVRDSITSVHHKRFDRIDDFVVCLADLRTRRGEIVSLRELRYLDLDLVARLEQEVAEESDRLARRCVEFLLRDDSLDPYERKVAEEQERISQLEKAADARKLQEQIDSSAHELEMLIEIVSNLKIDDATHRTKIIDNISNIFARVNQARTALKKKSHDLASVEGVAEFNSQLKLLNQAVVNYLDLCETPEKCEEFLTRIMIQIEELEGRFAEFDEFVLQLTEKREEIYNAFESRKLALVEVRNRRASALAGAADRILKGIKTRVESLESINEINSYFSADLMIDKVRDIVGQLQRLDDSVKVDDIQSRLKTIREDAVRQLKDRKELYVDGQNIIRFGARKFTVNVQALDLTLVRREKEQYLHLTGTNFFERLDNEQLNATRSVWDQEVVSENADVYRGEYLAYLLLERHRQTGTPTREQLEAMSLPELQAHVAEFMGPRYSEGYVKGVHDHDAALLFQNLVELDHTIGLLRYSPRARALADLYWSQFVEEEWKAEMSARLRGFGAVTRLFPETVAQREYVAELCQRLGEFSSSRRLFPELLAVEAGEYLFFELTSGRSFCTSRSAANLFREFHEHLRRNHYTEQFQQSVDAVRNSRAGCFQLVCDWVRAFLQTRGEADETEYTEEVALRLMAGKIDPQTIVEASVVREVQGLTGAHPRVQEGGYHLHFNRFCLRLQAFQREVAPRFMAYTQLKKDLVEQAREELRLEEFRPRVLTSFVRNRLLDEVYLPLIGDNLAKQMGEAGEGKRTDRMGLLLLISPPGYGKTTLMEYVANRLGLIFMKINGPAIGHEVTSLDPNAAPNAGAREEVEKLNLSLEMGDNVMIYLDDIQHCNPEFLQKFISLCDAQRKIEGVYKGKTRTYDLRGRKVAVVMAGNPYTESGEKFQIPDMLANRADIYNLGEIIGENRESFEMSYLENCLTSNPALNKMSTRSQKDVYEIMRLASLDQPEAVELEGNYSAEEVNEMVAVMKKLMRVRDVILKVNREYIRSAAQSDDYRTEPAFKLQGSYRNMNRIAEKVVAIMNDAELQSLIVSNYENDAQTLTTGTESNLLKFKEIMGILSEEERKRWEDIKRTFTRNVKLKGIGSDDKFGQAIMQLSTFSDGLDAIRDTLADGVTRLHQPQKSNGPPAEVTELIAQVQGIQQGLSRLGENLEQGLVQMGSLLQARSAEDRTGGAAAAPQIDMQVLRELAAEIRALSAAGGDPAVTAESVATEPGQHQRITVVNRVPRTMLNVMQQQFQLMQDWLQPLAATSQAQRAEMEEFSRRLQQVLESYQELMSGLGDARRRAQRET